MSTFLDIVKTLRKETRLLLALPVKVLAQEHSSAHWTCTYEVSRAGVRLQNVPGVAVGQEIWIQRQNRKARYRVAWIGQPETAHAGQMAAECLEEKVIWDDEVKGRLI
jgi:hypothetical protein